MPFPLSVNVTPPGRAPVSERAGVGDPVLVTLNVGAARLDAVVALLPSRRSPTVSKLFGAEAYAVETVVPRDQINTLIPALKDAGATDIIELPISKIVH